MRLWYGNITWFACLILLSAIEMTIQTDIIEDALTQRWYIIVVILVITIIYAIFIQSILVDKHSHTVEILTKSKHVSNRQFLQLQLEQGVEPRRLGNQLTLYYDEHIKLIDLSKNKNDKKINIVTTEKHLPLTIQAKILFENGNALFVNTLINTLYIAIDDTLEPILLNPQVNPDNLSENSNSLFHYVCVTSAWFIIVMLFTTTLAKQLTEFNTQYYDNYIDENEDTNKDEDENGDEEESQTISVDDSSLDLLQTLSDKDKEEFEDEEEITQTTSPLNSPILKPAGRKKTRFEFELLGEKKKKIKEKSQNRFKFYLYQIRLRTIQMISYIPAKIMRWLVYKTIRYFITGKETELQIESLYEWFLFMIITHIGCNLALSTFLKELHHFNEILSYTITVISDCLYFIVGLGWFDLIRISVNLMQKEYEMEWIHAQGIVIFIVAVLTVIFQYSWEHYFIYNSESNNPIIKFCRSNWFIVDLANLELFAFNFGNCYAVTDFGC